MIEYLSHRIKTKIHKMYNRGTGTYKDTRTCPDHVLRKSLEKSYFCILSWPCLRQNLSCPEYLQIRSAAPVLPSSGEVWNSNTYLCVLAVVVVLGWNTMVGLSRMTVRPELMLTLELDLDTALVPWEDDTATGTTDAEEGAAIRQRKIF